MLYKWWKSLTQHPNQDKNKYNRIGHSFVHSQTNRIEKWVGGEVCWASSQTSHKNQHQEYYISAGVIQEFKEWCSHDFSKLKMKDIAFLFLCLRGRKMCTWDILTKSLQCLSTRMYHLTRAGLMLDIEVSIETVLLIWINLFWRRNKRYFYTTGIIFWFRPVKLLRIFGTKHTILMLHSLLVNSMCNDWPCCLER